MLCLHVNTQSVLSSAAKSVVSILISRAVSMVIRAQVL